MLVLTVGYFIKALLHLIARSGKAGINMAEAVTVVSISILVKAGISNTKTLLRIVFMLGKARLDAENTLLLLVVMVALGSHGLTLLLAAVLIQQADMQVSIAMITELVIIVLWVYLNMFVLFFFYIFNVAILKLPIIIQAMFLNSLPAFIKVIKIVEAIWCRA